MTVTLKKIALTAVLVGALVLASTGLMDRGLNWSGLRHLEHVNDRYLDQAFAKALAGFLVLSGIKSGLAIVEGSSIGVGFNLELGDVVQPIYDYVDIAWRAALAGGSIIAAMQLALGGVALVDQWALALLLIVLIAWNLSEWLMPPRRRLHRMLREASRFSAMLCLVLYLLLPLAVTGAAVVSRHITGPLIEASHEQFQELGLALEPGNLHREFFAQEAEDEVEDLSILDLKGNITRFSQGTKALIAFMKARTEHIAEMTIKLIAAYLFDCIIFPLFFGLILMTMVRSVVRYIFDPDRPSGMADQTS